MNDDTASNPQALTCSVCQKVNMADGTQVWVCKEGGTQHQPGEPKVADAAAAAKAVVDQAASVAPPVTPGVPTSPDTTTPTQ